MDGFLVMLRCEYDDIPVQLCATEEDALSYAATMKWERTDNTLKYFPEMSTLLSICVVEFMRGRVARLSEVRNYEDELNLRMQKGE